MTGAEILMGVAVVGGVLGTVASAQSQKYEANAEASIADYNAQVARQEADMARQQGVFNETIQREQDQRRRASMRAAVLSHGVTSEGSPILAEADQAAQDEISALAIRYGAAVDATRAESKAQGYQYQAAALRQGGKNKAAATLFSGFSQAAGLGAGLFRPSVPAPAPPPKTGK